MRNDWIVIVLHAFELEEADAVRLFTFTEAAAEFLTMEAPGLGWPPLCAT